MLEGEIGSFDGNLGGISFVSISFVELHLLPLKDGTEISLRRSTGLLFSSLAGRPLERTEFILT
jgi:hypothetical protein